MSEAAIRWRLGLKGKQDTTPHATSVWRNERLSEEASGGRNWRRVSQQICAIIPGPHCPEGRGSTEDKSDRHIREFQLARFKFVFGLLFGLFASGDLFAKFARMLAVESLHDRFAEGRLLRETNYHPRPSHGLQERPVQPNRAGKSQGNQNSWQPREHRGTL